MKVNFIKRISKILLLSSVFFSCSSDLDFDQAKDLKLEPVFVANLAYFNVSATQFANSGGGQVVFDEQEFDAFKDKYFRENLVKAELDFEIENTIIRAFTVDVVLLDANNQILETDSYPIPAYSGSSNIIKYPTEVFENQRLELLKKTVKIAFFVRMAPGPALDQSSTGNLKLRSGATVYMEIK
ncbi:hypothetical protein BC749_10281 [Flavobacterium araucananum]|jgi:hypothetical protein|uniref:DUF1735 domain-containing protein n=1 Tax=Flavobacterium araucananum TaxID=946678 RepID=A0A227PAD6_9FLAO|nr:hypothetical protein [Flavobacterium araucananum]OXG06344.1 hypothetical protein B0A64_11315 [Flavobacterium araucananum]PWK00519.1 hypothetical protein BC749_10281 [Flavobacterium araucananum]